MNSYGVYWQLKGFEDEYFSSPKLSVEFVLTYINRLMADNRVHSLGVVQYVNASLKENTESR